MGADFAYIGSAFIATEEANAPARYKEMIVESAADDILYSPVFTGVPGNYLRPSIVAAGLDPASLADVKAVTMDFGNRDESGKQVKAWRDVWGSGQGIGAVEAVVPTAALVERLGREYRAALGAGRRIALGARRA